MLADMIRSGRPDTGVAAWWLGQAGFVFRSADVTVVVDPFLTDFGHYGRTYPPPCAPSQLDGADIVLCTHDHADHVDPEGLPQLLSAAPAARLLVPAAVAGAVAAHGIDASRIVGVDEGDAMEPAAGLSVRTLAAFHANQPADGYGFHRDAAGRHPFLGYIIELGGVRIGHVGDTLVYPGLAERLRDAELDVLILPINGRSWFRERRGLVGNMNVFEAAELADRAHARRTVPVHWDLFADNTEDPEHFARYAAARHPGVRVEIPAVGRRLDW
jgi:L-ascorbate metabolism protein UlaG (beta-lactamase superfamily)